MDFITYRWIYLPVVPSVNVISHYRQAMVVGKFFEFMKSEPGFPLPPFSFSITPQPPSTSNLKLPQVVARQWTLVDGGGDGGKRMVARPYWRFTHWWWHENGVRVADERHLVGGGVSMVALRASGWRWPMRHGGCWRWRVYGCLEALNWRWRFSGGKSILNGLPSCFGSEIDLIDCQWCLLPILNWFVIKFVITTMLATKLELV